MNIEKKLNTIQETQKEILEFLKEKERATLQGNFNVLSDIMGNFKYNWDNDTYKTNKHLGGREEKRTAAAMESFTQNRMNVTQPFIENIRMVNELYNKTATYFFDGENVYIQKGVG